MPTISATALEELAIAAFVQDDVHYDDADLVARLLVKSNLAGHDSHGVVRIPQYVEGIATGRLRPGAPLAVPGPRSLGSSPCTVRHGWVRPPGRFGRP